ncbi:hypothetical protein DTO013E5_6424 [Penicillium roqueforti]|uniref:Genomic scaffold, ProqFM164S04 n=1 Tax=Penicillium roqueforti (strain FM164) TaxID=1365484 RepID=W6R1J7_PENRF|nr:uncharacterized protein LCP9604111_7415 [Penicillium roqueforti]CDM35702.1 unnamed protein product [Penicillium roqueforti FM164]KAF9243981.1 hypothetical protein LCP9604111_7415 [Penicillium roqueforti]KAI1831341.1 hypothetical protein CBS147337_7807 [Penicillium roqueforti]KAI2671452.1 hypothetical protein CBS147355_8734 [Penicillium roqueforti]KAI2684801.1 hypothetical protein LCP963914a_4893 [Penicillium roqueforti]
MSLPYLKSLKKPELAELADQTELPNYNDYNKNDLVVVLDRHLRENRSIFSGLKSLSEYYLRLASPPRRGGSPVKRESARTPARTPARRSTKKEVREEETDENNEDAEEPEPSPTVISPTPAVGRTSARQSARQTPQQTPRQPAVLSTVVDSEPSLPASPAAITEAIDAQTLKLRERIEDAWTASGLVERAHSLRATLSSGKAVEIIVLLLESGSLAKELIPIRFLTTTPVVQAVQIPAIRIRVPDLFVLLEGTFWGPFSLWFLTCLLLPLISAYFINLSWNASSSTRRTQSAPNLAQFDPLTFNIVKALLVHIVFGKGFNFFGFYSRYAIGKVIDSVPGGDLGILTGSAIGGVTALYEAILHRP